MSQLHYGILFAGADSDRHLPHRNDRSRRRPLHRQHSGSELSYDHVGFIPARAESVAGDLLQPEHERESGQRRGDCLLRAAMIGAAMIAIADQT
jgi:hypothetical protein